MPTENPYFLIKTYTYMLRWYHYETHGCDLYHNGIYSPRMYLLVNTNIAVALVTIVGSLVI